MRAVGDASTSAHISEGKALGYIQEATGMTASAKPVGFGSRQGQYVIIVSDADRGHALYGRVSAGGKQVIYDPQTARSYGSLAELKEEGWRFIRPFLLK